MDPTSQFAEGGPIMFAIVALNSIGVFFLFIAFVLAIVARVKGKAVGAARFFTILALIGCFIPLCAGLGGKMYGQNQADVALEYASPESAEALREAGAQVANIPFRFGACSTMCCLIPAIVILMVLPRKRSAWETALDDE